MEIYELQISYNIAIVSAGVPAMTEALATTGTGTQMRVLDSPIGKVIPVADIAENLGYNRSSITKAIARNAGVFGGLTQIQSLKTPGGMQDFLCLNQIGIERLILLLRPMKDRVDLFKRIEAFRLKAFGQLAESRKETALVQQQPSGIIGELQEARELAALCGKSPELFQAAVLKKHGKTELAEVLDASPSIIHSNAGYYTPTRLIELFCHDPLLTPKRFNKFLSNARENNEWRPFQYRDENKIWRLAPRGIPHGKEIMYEVPDSGGHKEIRVLWKESILYASGLKRQAPEDRAALTARA
jgi:hypothetical protein